MSGGAAEESVKVLNTWFSAYGMRVLIALKEKGLAYEYQEEDLPDHKSLLLLQSNPVYKKVPVLLHNGKPICESLIILQYIDEAWPSPHYSPFLPSDPQQRALARFWADYVDKKVYGAIILIYKNVEGSDAMEQGKRDLKESVVVLDGALRDVFGGGPYFGGEHMGLVDIALAPFLCWLHTLATLANFNVLEDTKCPHFSSWTQTVLHQPSVKEVFSICPPHKLLETVLALRKRFLISV